MKMFFALLVAFFGLSSPSFAHLDKRFGYEGQNITSLSSTEDRGEVVVVKPDSKIVAAGVTSYQTRKDVGIMQLTDDGHLDDFFGKKGKIVVSLKGAESVYGIVALKNGEVIVGGHTVRKGTGDFFLIGLTKDGKLNPSFGNRGIVQTDFGGNEELHYLVKQPDEKMIAVGFTTKKRKTNLIVARYLKNGALDTTFGHENGWIEPDLTKLDRAYGVALQKDGKIVVTGAVKKKSKADCFVWRFLPDGMPDLSFNGTSFRIIPFSQGDDMCSSVAITREQKIVVSGYAVFPKTGADFIVGMLNPDGSLDRAFSQDGKKVFDINGGHDVSHAVSVLSNGSILVAGEYQLYPKGPYKLNLNRFVAAKLNQRGEFMTTFDHDGILKYDFPGEEEESCEGMVIDQKGRALLIGRARKNFGVLRLVP